MKQVIILTALFFSLTAMAAKSNAPVDEKVLITFNQVFKDAKNVQWYTNGNYTEAYFESNKIKTKARLDNSGALLQTIRYYTEEHLPANIAFRVKKKFDKQSIWGVTEISNEEGINYEVVLRDEKNWYRVKCNASGNIDAISKNKRGDL